MHLPGQARHMHLRPPDSALFEHYIITAGKLKAIEGYRNAVCYNWQLLVILDVWNTRSNGSDKSELLLPEIDFFRKCCVFLEFTVKKWYDETTNRKGLKHGKYI